MAKIKIEQLHIERQMMSMLHYSYIIKLYVSSEHIQELVGAFFQYENAVFNGKQEKESIIRVRMGIEKSAPCDHHLSSPGKPRDTKR